MTTLEQIAQLARALVDAGQEVTTAEELLKRAKEHERMLAEETIPAILQELGIKELKLDSGDKLSIRQEVFASIPPAKRAEAFTWLDENGFGGVIKSSVSINFGRSELEKAIALCAQLSEQGVAPELIQKVEPMTLKALLKEQLAAGVDVPLETFGARPVWTTKLTKK